MNLANKITILRILLIPFFIASILYSKWQAALFIFFIAAISDGIDGYIARMTKKRSQLGKFLDPIADKLLIISAFICLSVAKDLAPALRPPAYIPIIVISRDGIILLGALLIYILKGSLEVKPTLISKITTFFQMATIIGILLKLAVSPLLWNIMVGFTICSGVDYVMRGSRILNEKA